jgi:hypothetical protein
MKGNRDNLILEERTIYNFTMELGKLARVFELRELSAFFLRLTCVNKEAEAFGLMTTEKLNKSKN